jgi:putative transposase
MAAAKRFFDKTMGANGDPNKVAMDKSGANKPAIKRATKPMLNFKSFRSAASVLAGIELMHMIRKGQIAIDGAEAMSFADQFSMLAEKIRPV